MKEVKNYIQKTFNEENELREFFLKGKYSISFSLGFEGDHYEETFDTGLGNAIKLFEEIFSNEKEVYICVNYFYSESDTKVLAPGTQPYFKSFIKDFDNLDVTSEVEKESEDEFRYTDRLLFFKVNLKDIKYKELLTFIAGGKMDNQSIIIETVYFINQNKNLMFTMTGKYLSCRIEAPNLMSLSPVYNKYRDLIKSWEREKIIKRAVSENLYDFSEDTIPPQFRGRTFYITNVIPKEKPEDLK